MVNDGGKSEEKAMHKHEPSLEKIWLAVDSFGVE
jgi:hypothetical protein